MSNTVTIGGNTYNVYGDPVACAKYIGGMGGGVYAKWRTLSTDDQARSQNQTCVYLDSIGLVDSSGNQVNENTAYAAVIQAAYELAAACGANPNIFNTTSGGSNLKSIKAGPSDIEYFAPVIASNLPLIVLQLLSPYFPGAGDVVAIGESTNTDACGMFTERLEWRYGVKGPL